MTPRTARRSIISRPWASRPTWSSSATATSPRWRRALGARAATVRAPEDVAAPVGEWLAALDGPLVLDCKVNPAVRAERLAEAFKGGA